MRHIFTVITLLSTLLASAQSDDTFRWGRDRSFPGYNLYREPCGTWEALPEEITGWTDYDTLCDRSKFDSVLNANWGLNWTWVYSEWEVVDNFAGAISMYFPCGNRTPITKRQYRICTATRIRQQRSRTVRFKYIEHVKNDYERALDSLMITCSRWSVLTPMRWRLDTLYGAGTTIRGFTWDTLGRVTTEPKKKKHGKR